MRILKNITSLFFIFFITQNLYSKNVVFNKTGKSISLTYFMDVPFSSKDLKAPFPSDIILPLPDKINNLPQPIDMHPLKTSTVRFSIICTKDDKTCKKIKPVKISTPKVYELNDYEVTFINGRLVVKKLDTVLGVPINSKK